MGKVLNSCEDVYVKALLDPFHPDALGVRVPALNPVDTAVHSQFDTITINVATYKPGGKLLLVFNPLAISAAPVMVLSDPEGVLPPFDSPAPLVKQVKTYDAFKSNVQLRTYGIWGMQVPGKQIFDYISLPVNPIATQLDTKGTGTIRLAACGLRIYKVSTAISESGILRVGYKPTGGAPQTSIDRMLETGPNSRYNVKIFPS